MASFSKSAIFPETVHFHREYSNEIVKLPFWGIPVSSLNFSLKTVCSKGKIRELRVDSFELTSRRTPEVVSTPKDSASIL